MLLRLVAKMLILPIKSIFLLIHVVARLTGQYAETTKSKLLRRLLHEAAFHRAQQKNINKYKAIVIELESGKKRAALRQ